MSNTLFILRIMIVALSFIFTTCSDEKPSPGWLANGQLCQT